MRTEERPDGEGVQDTDITYIGMDEGAAWVKLLRRYWWVLVPLALLVEVIRGLMQP